MARRTFTCAILVLLVSAFARADDAGRLAQLAEDLKIDLVYRDALDEAKGDVHLTGDAMTAAAWAQFAPVLLSELQKYPEKLLDRCGIKKLVIVRKLSWGERGLMYSAAPGAKALYLDGTAYAWDRRSQRRQIARAVYSMLDLPGSFEEEWLKLNPPGHKYVPARLGKQPDSYFGFFDDRCRASMKEDMATTFAFLMTDPARTDLRAERDKWIREKVAAIKAALREAVPEMNKEFWTKMARLQEQIAEDDRAAVMRDPSGYIQEQLVDLAAKYNIEIIWDKVPAFSSNLGNPPAEKDLAKYAPIFIRELGRYSPEVIRRIYLKRIVIVGKFNEGDAAALANYETSTLYFNANEKGDDEWQRKTIHHEMFHLIDMADDGTYKDKEWEAINGGDFKYVYSLHPSSLSDAFAGFVSEYAQDAIEEDKAETFSAMMTRLSKLELRAEKDKVLAAKLDYMKKLTGKFNDAMGSEFWERQRATSAVLKQRYPAGRYKLRTVADSEESGGAGLIRTWGSSEMDMTVGRPDGDGKQKITLKLAKISQNFRGAGITLSYDSTDSDDPSDRTLMRMLKPMLGAVFTTGVDEDGRLDRIRGMDEIAAKIREDDEALALQFADTRHSIENSIRYIALPSVRKLLPEQAVRKGDKWKGLGHFAWKSLPEGEVKEDCSAPRIEGDIAVVATSADLAREIKDDKNPEKLQGYKTGEMGVSMKTGMVMWAKYKIVIVYKSEKTVVNISTKITPVEE